VPLAMPLPASVRELERLVDPTLGFDWDFIAEALGVEARKAQAAEAVERISSETGERGEGGGAGGRRGRRASGPVELEGEAMAFLSAWSAMGRAERGRWMKNAEEMLRGLWVECGVSARDRSMFEIAFLQKAREGGGVGGDGEALGVAEHLSVLAEYVAARDAVRSAVRDRREVLGVLRTLLQEFDADQRPLCESVVAPLRKGGSVGGGGGGVEVDAEFATFLRLPMATVFPGGRAGTVERMYGAMSEEERRLCVSVRVRVRVLLLSLLQATLAVTEGVERMRMALWRPLSVVLDGRDVLDDIRGGDVAPLLKYPLSCVLYFLRVPADEVRVATAFFAPPPPSGGAGSGVGGGGGGREDGEDGEDGEEDEGVAEMVEDEYVLRQSTRATVVSSGASARVAEHPAPRVPFRKLVVPPEFRAPETGSVLQWMGAEGVVPDLRVVQRVDRAVRLVQDESEVQWKIAFESRELEAQGLFIPAFRWRRNPDMPAEGRRGGK
jgi:hypothetical protein